MRRGKTDRVPKTRAGNTWSECAFFAFIRSGLRQLSRRWPPLVRHAMVAARRTSQSDNKRLKWEYQCESCKEWHPSKEVAVDHIVPCGSLKSFDDLRGFTERLFCEVENLRVLCNVCHALRTSKHEQPEISGGRIEGNPACKPSTAVVETDASPRIKKYKKSKLRLEEF